MEYPSYMYIYCVRKLRRTYIHVHSTPINIQHVHGSCKCVSLLFSVFTCARASDGLYPPTDGYMFDIFSDE